MTKRLFLVLLVCLAIPLHGDDTCINLIPLNEPADCSPPTPPGQPVSFAGDSGPTRVRKSVWDLSDQEVLEVRNAFAALRELTLTDPRDPRGWLLQANVHCWYCGGGTDSHIHGEEIHGGYWFFPWHRAYLYFLEKTLGQLVGNPSLALPYWDWDTPGHDQLPPPYTPKLTPNATLNSLYDPFRGEQPGQQLPPNTVNGVALQKVMYTAGWQGFMGVNPSSPDADGGVMENGPHGIVHLWTADPNFGLRAAIGG